MGMQKFRRLVVPLWEMAQAQGAALGLQYQSCSGKSLPQARPQPFRHPRKKRPALAREFHFSDISGPTPPRYLSKAPPPASASANPVRCSVAMRRTTVPPSPREIVHRPPYRKSCGRKGTPPAPPPPHRTTSRLLTESGCLPLECRAYVPLARLTLDSPNLSRRRSAALWAFCQR